jgi:hypothetical protein
VQALSLAWGILAVGGMLVGFIPCFGWLNWLNIPFAFAGLIFSVIAHAVTKGQRQNSLVAIILCVLAILIGSKRLVAGFGIF